MLSGIYLLFSVALSFACCDESSGFLRYHIHYWCLEEQIEDSQSVKSSDEEMLLSVI